MAGLLGPSPSGGLLDFILNGADTAGRDLFGGYYRAMNPAIMNEPFGAWQRLGMLGMSAPTGAVGNALAASSFANTLHGLGYGADAGRLFNMGAGAVTNQTTPTPQQGLLHDPYTGAFVDPQGQRWY